MICYCAWLRRPLSFVLRGRRPRRAYGPASGGSLVRPRQRTSCSGSPRKSFRNHLAVLASLFALILSACSGRPITELVLADVALKAAQKAKADSLATDYFRKAENHFLRARKDYTDGYFDSCKRYANEARILAEKAEYRALLKQAQIKSGNVGSGGETY